MKNNWDQAKPAGVGNAGIFIRENFWLENSLSQSEGE